MSDTSNKQFVIEEVPFPVLRVARNGTLVHANRSAGQLLDHWQCRVGDYLPPSVREFVSNAFVGIEQCELETHCMDSDLSFSFVPTVDGDYVNLFGRDVSAQKKVEASLLHHNDILEERIAERTIELIYANEQLKDEIAKCRNAEEELRSAKEIETLVFNQIGVGIALISPTMEILSMNPIMQQWSPHVDPSIHPICYKSFKVPPADDVCSYCPVVLTLRDGKSHVAVTETSTADGIRHFRVISTPVIAQDGSVTAVIEVVEDITELKETEQQLAILSFALNQVSEEVYLFDEHSRFRYVNEEACRALGYSREELLGLILVDIDLDFDAKRWAEHWQDLKCRGSVTFESHHKRRDGHLYQVEVTANYFEYEGNGYSLGFVRDITEKKKEDEKRSQQEALYRSLVESTSAVLWELDHATSRFTYVSSQAVTIFGYPLESWTDLGFWAGLIHPDERDTVVSLCKKAAATGESHQFDYRIKRADGSYLWVLDVVTVVMEKEKPARLHGFMIDITRQKENEDALRRQSELLDLAHDAIFVRNLDERIIYWNRGAEERYGWSGQEVVGDVAHFLLKTKFPEPFEDLYMHLVKKGYWEGELIHTTRDGVQITESSRWALQRDGVGKPLAILEINSDITKRKQMEEELRTFNASLERRVEERTEELISSNREMESFCYSISHELRAPIARLEGYSWVITECTEAGDLSRLPFYAERIIHSSQHLRIVIDALLTLNRLSRAEIKSEELDLSEMAVQIATELSEDDEGMQVKIASGVKGWGDRGMLTLCLHNLLGNAVKYTGKTPNPEMEFGVSRQGGQPVYFVRDNGIGFEMEYAGKLFQPFSRLHGEHEFEGSGIGLAIAQRVIERHRGRIWSESAPGQGATFYFTLGPGEKG